MAKILSNPTHVAQKGYNSFPIRQRKQFSSTVGHLLPVYYDYLSPGDKVSCGAELFTRMQPMVAPWMGNLETHIDWFFVPMEQIYSYFGDAFYGIQDFKSDFVGASTARATNILPSFDSYVLRLSFENAFRSGNIDLTDMEILTADRSNRFRLLDHLGFPVKRFWECFFYAFRNGVSHDGWFKQVVDIWFVAAYNKIWSDHYRLDDWQENNSFLYNFDSFVKSDTNRSDLVRFENVFTLHRVPFKRDYFTYTLPSPIFNTNAFNSLDTDSLYNVNQWLTSLSRVYPFGSADNATTISMGTGNTPQSNVNPANLRTLFAMEKMLEVTRRAGKHYDSQTLAHFGINVPSGLNGECTFLAGQTVSMQPDEVFSTAETTNVVDGEEVLTPLGSMSGKAASYGRKGNIRYEAKCHGVLMAVMYTVPDVVYEQRGLDRLHSYVRPQDFFHPELDDLGMQPLFNYEVEYPTVLDSSSTFPSSVLAWKYRYSELKSKYNVAFGNLIGDMSPWSIKRESVLNVNGTYNWDSLIVPANFLNQVMLVDFLGNVPASDAIPDVSSYSGNLDTDNKWKEYGDYVYNQIYSRDPLMHDLYLNVNKASKMSTFGLPSL